MDYHSYYCEICFEHKNFVHFLPCNHTLCGSCLKRLSNNICPFCREDFNDQLNYVPPQRTLTIDELVEKRLNNLNDIHPRRSHKKKKKRRKRHKLFREEFLSLANMYEAVR